MKLFLPVGRGNVICKKTCVSVASPGLCQNSVPFQHVLAIFCTVLAFIFVVFLQAHQALQMGNMLEVFEGNFSRRLTSKPAFVQSSIKSQQEDDRGIIGSQQMCRFCSNGMQLATESYMILHDLTDSYIIVYNHTSSTSFSWMTCRNLQNLQNSRAQTLDKQHIQHQVPSSSFCESLRWCLSSQGFIVDLWGRTLRFLIMAAEVSYISYLPALRAP